MEALLCCGHCGFTQGNQAHFLWTWSYTMSQIVIVQVWSIVLFESQKIFKWVLYSFPFECMKSLSYDHMFLCSSCVHLFISMSTINNSVLQYCLSFRGPRVFLTIVSSMSLPFDCGQTRRWCPYLYSWQMHPSVAWAKLLKWKIFTALDYWFNPSSFVCCWYRWFLLWKCLLKYLHPRSIFKSFYCAWMWRIKIQQKAPGCDKYLVQETAGVWHHCYPQ